MATAFNTEFAYRRYAFPALALTVSLCLAGSCAAQSDLHDQAFGHVARLGESPVGFTHGSVIVAPIPVENPTLGTGLALGAGYLFKVDPGSHPSYFGVGGLKTDDGSTAYALAGKLNFGDGRWDVHGVAGYADLDYDLYVLGVPIPIARTGAFGRLGASYGVTKAFSAGMQFGYVESDLGLDAAALPESFALDFGIGTATADVVLAWDTRDNTIYPTSGVNASLRAGWGTVVEGPARDFTRGLAKAAFYLPLADETVLAGQAAACRVSDKTPFS